jgi:glycosyltransferase involved in cell wall biosynthesis
MSRPPTITAAIIAQDEAQNLRKLLPQLAWVDEIVVVDGGSTDGTVAVARSHGARVLCRRFDSFARQRNHALRAATGRWVFSIDADERPTPPLVAEIRRRIASGREAGFRVPIRSCIFGRRFRGSGTQDDRPIRLVLRGAACWVGDVHERLHVAGRVGQLRSWLRHETIPDLHAFLSKVHRYTLLEARARVEAGRAPRRCDAWWAPAREVFRRLVWKRGFVDGPEGWAFCVLSGLSEWVLAERHRRLWRAAQSASSRTAARPSRTGSVPARVAPDESDVPFHVPTPIALGAESAAP